MIPFLLKLAASCLLIWLVLRGVEFDQLVGALRNVDVGGLAAAWAMLAALWFTQAYRWRVITRALSQPLAYRDAVLAVIVGQFFNQSLPSTVGGDVMRVWRAQRAGMTFGGAVNSVLIDRGVALVALLLLVAISLPVAQARIADPVARAGLWLVIGLGAGGLGLALSMDRLPLPAPLARLRPVAAVAALARDVRRVFFAPATISVVLAVSMVSHLVVVASVLMIARALAIPVGFLDCLILVPPVLMVAAVPISVAGWGLREGAMVTAFAFVGVAAPQALALSLLLGLVLLLVGAVGAPVWLMSGRPSAEALRAGAADPDAAVRRP